MVRLVSNMGGGIIEEFALILIANGAAAAGAGSIIFDLPQSDVFQLLVRPCKYFFNNFTQIGRCH